MLPTRTVRAQHRLPFALILGVGILGFAILMVFRKGGGQTGLRQSAIGRSTASALEAYIKTNHLCPPTLATTALMLPVGELTSLHYRAWDGHTKCEFTAGDYGLDGGEEYWHYPPGDWHVYRE